MVTRGGSHAVGVSDYSHGQEAAAEYITHSQACRRHTRNTLLAPEVAKFFFFFRLAFAFFLFSRAMQQAKMMVYTTGRHHTRCRLPSAAMLTHTR